MASFLLVCRRSGVPVDIFLFYEIRRSEIIVQLQRRDLRDGLWRRLGRCVCYQREPSELKQVSQHIVNSIKCFH